MAEYIERDAALEIVKRTSGDYATAFAEIRKIPAADVAPVVRCKDCKYAYINSFSAASGVLFCSSSMKAMQQDDFCSYGERKDGDTDDEV
jgi:hypothetical protein